MKATKENSKGSIRSYNSRRKTLISLLLVLSSSLFYFLLYKDTSALIVFRTKSNGNNLQRIDKEHNNGIGSISTHPIHSMNYGNNNIPLVMIQSSLSHSLHEEFLKHFLYSCTETELNSNTELDNRVNIPYYIYEGYYHSLSTNTKIYSRNPNPMIGKDFMKPPADPFTRAFFDTFRQINTNIFDKLKNGLVQASKSLEKENVCGILANWIGKGYHFGDLSIQFHYGKGNIEKLRNGMAWHTDAENSLLHLAVTLRGERILHSMRKEDLTSKLMEVLDKQKEGDVYLSSSALMRHAPEFFDTEYDSRVIAIHARILYTSADLNHFRKVRTDKSWKKLTSVLADTLASADLRMPSLEQVESRMVLLS